MQLAIPVVLESDMNPMLLWLVLMVLLLLLLCGVVCQHLHD
jgi:hypothetical protein